MKVNFFLLYCIWFDPIGFGCKIVFLRTKHFEKRISAKKKNRILKKLLMQLGGERLHRFIVKQR